MLRKKVVLFNLAVEQQKIQLCCHETAYRD